MSADKIVELGTRGELFLDRHLIDRMDGTRIVLHRPRSTQGAGCSSVPLAFQVKDVDAEYERLKTLGVAFVKPPQTYPWGARSFWFRDPDGHIVDFYTPAPRG